MKHAATVAALSILTAAVLVGIVAAYYYSGGYAMK